jgi:hypothetical protein
VSAVAGLKQRVFDTARDRAVRAGRIPRQAYEHYFIESDGLHSRVHLQNFWSTFWPHLDGEAVANIEVCDAGGRVVGRTTRPVPKFGQLFLELRDLLGELGLQVPEGTVAIDLEPPAAVREHLRDVPNAAAVEINTPFWMAYYDDDENYMYVHSIEKLRGPVFGSTWALERLLDRGEAPVGERWRSWRLLDADELEEIQVVVINHAERPASTTVGIYDPEDRPVVERRLDFGPRALHRVRFRREELGAGMPEGTRFLRVGLDPTLTVNGKPYVLMRYGGGPLSLHHG